MQIEFNNRFKIQDLDVACKIDLRPGKMTLLVGENGIGKSSFIRFLKLHQSEFFKGMTVNFMDQFPLSPINQISYFELKRQISECRQEDLHFFTELEMLSKEYHTKPINDLSGGQNQMIKLLLTCLRGGDIFIFDEPFQYLDKQNSQKLKEVLQSLKELGKTVLVVEHHHDKIKDIIDETFTISQESNEIRIH